MCVLLLLLLLLLLLPSGDGFPHHCHTVGKEMNAYLWHYISQPSIFTFVSPSHDTHFDYIHFDLAD